jgi:DNA-binding IclR family transcriptional regulator
MATALESNKTKIAKRMIEVLEFFADRRCGATVMDIVRRYDRPQSSTSELLASLVEMGLLYKDAHARSYTPTPRLAALGAAAQPGVIRDGRLFAFMDQLAYSTRCGVALIGMVGTHAQIFRWSDGGNPLTCDLGCGASEPLCDTTAGLLLLSTMNTEQAGRTLWRLNAEAAAGRKFNATGTGELVAAFRRQGNATGPAGYVPKALITATLLPRRADERPLVVGLIYPVGAAVSANALLGALEGGIAQCAAPSEDVVAGPSFAPMMMAV